MSLLSLLGGLPTLGQHKYRVSILDTDKELSGSVYCIHQDRRGFAWMGVPGGLCRYDGNQIYFVGDSTIRPVDLVRTIVGDPNGNLWLGVTKVPSFVDSYSTLYFFERKTERFTNLKEKTKEGWQPFRGIPLALIGTKLWCFSYSKSQLFYLDVHTRRKTVVLQNVPFFNDNNFFDHSSTYDGKRYLWLHLVEGILRFDTQTLESSYLFASHPANKLGKPTFFSHFKLTHNGIYAATKDFTGLLIGYDLKTFSKAPATQEFFAPNNAIVSLPNAAYPHYPTFKTFGNGIVWLWNYNYIYKLNPLLPKFHNVSAKTYTLPVKLSIRGFLRLNDSLLRVNLDDYKVLIYNTNSRQLTVPSATDVLNNIGGRTLRTLDGAIWVMTKKGLLRFLPTLKKKEVYINPDTLQPSSKFANTIRDMFEISAQQLLLNTESGMFVFDRLSKIFKRIPFFGPTGRLSLCDRQGTLFVSFDGKLHIGRVQDTVWTATAPPLPGAIFRNGFDDAPRQRILGASASGLFIISKKKWEVTKLTTKDGLASSYVYDVLPDEKGQLWISTARGLSKVTLSPKKVDNFRLTDGLQSYDFNSRTAFSMPDGEMYFGGSRGFNHFYPSEVKFNDHLSKPYLTQLTVKEKPYRFPTVIGEATSITLPPDITSFAIHYSAIDYFSEGVNTYQYRLVGSDSTWINAENQTIARFTQLPAGEYVFEVKAANSDGLWNPTPTQLKIHIQPYFWQTFWFRFLLLMVIGLGLYALYRYRLQQLTRQQRKEIRLMVKTQEAERKRFASEVHDGIGANLTALRIMIGLLGRVDTPTLRTKLEGVLDTTFDDLRGLINDTSPRMLKSNGLVNALRERAALINQSQRLFVIINVSRVFPARLPEEYEVNLYRIVQELLQNTIKHADATEAVLYLDYKHRHLWLHYTDNGKGFDLATAQQKNSNGLANLHARTQLLNGTIQIDSTAQRGIVVKIEVPFV